MAADYLFVSMTFTFVMGTLLMVLGIENREYPNAVVYHFFAAISFYYLSMQFLMGYGSTSAVLPAWMYFFGFGSVNFVLFFVWVWQVFNIWRRKRMGVEADEE